jgi:hypothetical protein
MPGGAVVFGTVRGHRVDNASRPSRPLTVMGESVRVQVNRIGDLAEAERYLDAMEQGSGLRGEPNSRGRLYVVEAVDIFAAH